MLKILNALISLLTFLFFLAFPLFYLPITFETHEFNKLALLILYVSLFFILSLLRIIFTGSLNIKRSTFLLPLFTISIIYLASTIINSPNKITPLVSPLSTSTIIASFVLFFLLLTDVTSAFQRFFFLSLSISAPVLSVYALAMYNGFLPKNILTPAGNLLTTTVFLSTAFLYLISSYIANFKTTSKRIKIIKTLTILAILSSISLLIYHLLKDQRPVILPLRFGWLIFLEILKNPKTLLLGVGPSNFMTIFTLTKPAAINATQLWNFTFTSSSTFLLNMATETGLITAALYFLLLTPVFKEKDKPLPTRIALFFLLIMQAILISSMTLFITTVILMALLSQSEDIKHITLPRNLFIKVCLLIISSSVVSYILYQSGRFYLAEWYYKKSFAAYAKKSGKEIYDWQRQAVNLNPYLDHYHVALSQTSLSLANALASYDNPTEDIKQSIPKLTQQAIDEARIAVALYPTNVINWDNLSKIFALLTNFAQGSSDRAKEASVKKLELDPVNPNIRLSHGTLLLSLKEYDEAEKFINQAIILKNDFPNAHFYLAKLYEETNRLQEATKELEITKSLLPTDSAEQKIVENELNAISQKLPK